MIIVSPLLRKYLTDSMGGFKLPKLSKYSTQLGNFTYAVQCVPPPVVLSKFKIPHSSFFILFGNASLMKIPLKCLSSRILTNFNKSLSVSGRCGNFNELFFSNKIQTPFCKVLNTNPNPFVVSQWTPIPYYVFPIQVELSLHF